MRLPQLVLCPDKRQRTVKVETESLVPWMMPLNLAKPCKTTGTLLPLSDRDVSLPR
jgi:hypothetical protein